MILFIIVFVFAGIAIFINLKPKKYRKKNQGEDVREKWTREQKFKEAKAEEKRIALEKVKAEEVG